MNLTLGKMEQRGTDWVDKQKLFEIVELIGLSFVGNQTVQQEVYKVNYFLFLHLISINKPNLI